MLLIQVLLQAFSLAEEESAKRAPLSIKLVTILLHRQTAKGPRMTAPPARRGDNESQL